MSELPVGFARLYTSALRYHLANGGELALHQAYELGRAALGKGFGILDLVLLHHDAIAELIVEPRVEDDLALRALAAEFLAECLSPFEMTLQGYREANARLSAANADLTFANAATVTAHEAFKAEVVERERAETALVHAQKLQTIGLLTGSIAHHINNLLTVMLGNLDLARRRIKDNDDVARFILSARYGTERAADVVKQLLTFSRQQKLEPRVVDTAQWLADVMPLIRDSLRGDIFVETTVPASLWPIRIDPAQLELALLNLGLNARDAMPGGGVLRLLAANRHLDDDRLALHGDYVVIEVSDTGEGVDPEILPRVFEPFFTTKEPGAGTGLGLSQVYSFIHHSGGAVDMKSVLGEGATVRIYLPASAGAVAHATGEALVAKPPDASGRVLVVDDDVEVADIVAQLLRGCGYSVRLAHRAQAALELLKTGEPIDLVFSDVIMPGGMSGVQLADEMRRSFPALPILLTTGYSNAIEQATAKGLDLITKPYGADELHDRIDALLRTGPARPASVVAVG
ncbi:MAG TPA: response regulator [Bradyrhizobium sp.]|nr:response regulator [Bradyrhizobium sp.]